MQQATQTLSAKAKLDDEHFMHLALREAARGIGCTSPNPAVGALIVSRDGKKILARGWHRSAGLPHAEIEALNALRKKFAASSAADAARGATLYVTLEPCSTHGRTPPCVDAIIRAGFARVVIGAIDPNPAHAGRGIEILKKAGIAVVAGVLNEECRSLNAAFNKWIFSKMPFVIAKCGMSLDGRITRAPGEGQWLTRKASRADAHALRAQVDAILIGAETLRVDNPRLTIRNFSNETVEKNRARITTKSVVEKKQPWRVIISRSGKNLPRAAHVFTDEHRERTIVFKKKSLRAVLRELGKREITSVLIEGGMRVLGEAFDKKLVDRVQFYIAPILVGGPKACVGGRGAESTAKASRIVNARCKKIGNDLRLTGDVEYGV